MIKYNIMENLYDWLFHYNFYKEEWSAFKRDDIYVYFSGGDSDKILKSKNQKDLIDFIIDSKGNVNKMKKLLK